MIGAGTHDLVEDEQGYHFSIGWITVWIHSHTFPYVGRPKRLVNTYHEKAHCKHRLAIIRGVNTAVQLSTIPQCVLHVCGQGVCVYLQGPQG